MLVCEQPSKQAHTRAPMHRDVEKIKNKKNLIFLSGAGLHCHFGVRFSPMFFGGLKRGKTLVANIAQLSLLVLSVGYNTS